MKKFVNLSAAGRARSIRAWFIAAVIVLAFLPSSTHAQLQGPVQDIGVRPDLLKDVGIAARRQLPEGCFLELKVSVEPGWQKRDDTLDEGVRRLARARDLAAEGPES